MCYYYSSSGRHSLRRIISVAFIVLSALDNVSNEQIVKDQEGLVECHQCFTHCKTLVSNRFDTSNCECGDDGDMMRSGDYSGDVLLSNNNDAHRIGGGAEAVAAAAAAQSVSKNKCLAKACFAKIEIFTHEKTAILQKGCINELPGAYAGCQYVGQSESIHCYCNDSNFCNTRQKLDNYNPRPMPVVECCECTGTTEEPCAEKECTKRCRGNYCLIDFDGVHQGCGIGIPRLQGFLRSSNYAKWQGHTTCARYQATEATLVHGCICSNPTGSCNEVSRSRSYQLKNVIQRRAQKDLVYCYSLQYSSSSRFGEEVFKNSGTCEGQYCFVSLTTSELTVEAAVSRFDSSEILQSAAAAADHKAAAAQGSSHSSGEYIGMSRQQYEITAGCLNVDDDNKVNVGCTIEYAKNISEPLLKHCICATHLCNFYTELYPNARSNLSNRTPLSVALDNTSGAKLSLTSSSKHTAASSSSLNRPKHSLLNAFIIVLLSNLLKISN